jgi:hypothetical protein
LRILPYLLFLAASVAFGANVGDTYESVIAEKGPPKSQIQVGTVRMLGYSDVTIKIRDNVVVSIKAVISAPTIPSQPRSAPSQRAPAAVSADALEAQLKDAVDRVNLIVNQPVPSVPRTGEISSQCAWFGEGWFHPGAATPDFNNVDIRKTQETQNYTSKQYVSGNLTPDVAFLGTDVEFNSMTKIFYQDRTLPKKKLTEEEMVEINRLYRIIGKCLDQLRQMGLNPQLQ